MIKEFPPFTKKYNFSYIKNTFTFVEEKHNELPPFTKKYNFTYVREY